MTILGQNAPPGDSAQMFPAECGSDAVRGLIREGFTKGFTHIQPDRQWCDVRSDRQIDGVCQMCA